jgi:hypothetical protein
VHPVRSALYLPRSSAQLPPLIWALMEMKNQDENSSETCPLLLTSRLVGCPVLEEMVPVELALSSIYTVVQRTPSTWVDVCWRLVETWHWLTSLNLRSRFVESCWTRLQTSCAACERRDRFTPGLNLAKFDLYQCHWVLTKWKETYVDVTFFAFKWIAQSAFWKLQCWGFISAQYGWHLNSGNSWKLILPPNWFNAVD